MLQSLVHAGIAFYASLPTQDLAPLMSDPAHLFHHLRIDQMPVTRSQARFSSHRERNPLSGRGRGRAPAALATPGRDLPPQARVIVSFTGRQYSTEALSPVSARRATEGLESTFSIDRIGSQDSGLERYFAFQLRTPVAVRIYEPDGGRTRVECTCETFQGSQSECVHIYVRAHHLVILQRS